MFDDGVVLTAIAVLGLAGIKTVQGVVAQRRGPRRAQLTAEQAAAYQAHHAEQQWRQERQDRRR